MDSKEWISAASAAASRAQRALALTPRSKRDAALRAVAKILRERTGVILEANSRDLSAFAGSEAFRDRLALNPQRIEAMAAGLEAIAQLDDPLDRSLGEWVRPNGLAIRRVPSAIGVIAMIYESRPNVGIDAAGLTLKSGNALILRGGSESFHSSQSLAQAFRDGLKAVELSEDAVQVAPSRDRALVGELLAAQGLIDLIIPRGGRSLVERVQQESKIPVLSHAEGLNHTYIHRSANPAMAREIVINAKMRRPSVCGATETLLIDRQIAPAILPDLIDDLARLGCRFRVDASTRALIPGLTLATEADFRTEWQDAVLSIAQVEGLDAAISHINDYGSRHTDAIIADDDAAARRFLSGIDSAVALWNASTQFSDGGEFGFGAEIGIATGRLHARGPIGLEQLTTFRYIVEGTGQTRPL